MKPRLLEHLVCPIDRTPLELIAWESVERVLGEADLTRAAKLRIDPNSLTTDVVTGVLLNRQRGIFYPIHQGVPRLLTFATGVAERFCTEHAARIKRELPGFLAPQETAPPGEQDVLRTFSSEWVNYDWNAQTYWSMTAEAWFHAMRFMLDLDARPLAGKLVLEMGIGVGGVADYVTRSEPCETIGVDLGYATEVAYRKFGDNPFLHVVQASAFAPPFRNAMFDFVYSFGVIHHTYSTRTACECLSRLPKPNGRIYIWVYSPHDEQRNYVRRTLMRVENIVRPVVWRLPESLQTIALAPFVPLYMAYQRLRSSRDERTFIRYGWREALHAARDRFTPRYIHRHTDQEVCGWLRGAGYDELRCDSSRTRPDGVPEFFTACTGVSGIRHIPSAEPRTPIESKCEETL